MWRRPRKLADHVPQGLVDLCQQVAAPDDPVAYCRVERRLGEEDGVEIHLRREQRLRKVVVQLVGDPRALVPPGELCALLLVSLRRPREGRHVREADEDVAVVDCENFPVRPEERERSDELRAEADREVEA